jgi:hypothetical protein
MCLQPRLVQEISKVFSYVSHSSHNYHQLFPYGRLIGRDNLHGLCSSGSINCILIPKLNEIQA